MFFSRVLNITPNNFNKTWILNQGKINHMDSEGNKQVAEQLSKLL